MCSCGSGPPSSPTTGPGAGAPATGPAHACPGAQSATQVVDELGIPVANEKVKITLGTGAVHNTTTDANGIVCFGSLSPGTTGQVELEDIDTHEAGEGDSTSTPSGQHFKTNGTGP